MKRARKFLNLDSADRALLIKALVLLWILRAGLWVLSFKKLDRLLERWIASRPAGKGRADRGAADRVSRAVAAAARTLPGRKNCLVQALACRTFLKRRGIGAVIRLGVLKDDSGRLEAHAWVESEGRVVIGARGIERFVPLDGTTPSTGKSPRRGRGDAP